MYYTTVNHAEIITSLHINYIFLLKNISNKYFLTIPQSLCILSISSTGINQTDLSKKLSIDLSTLSRNLDKLITKNLIDKSLDAHDKRTYIINLTTSGNVLCQNLIDGLNNEFLHIIQNISIDDYDPILNYVSIMNWEIEKLKHS